MTETAAFPSSEPPVTYSLSTRTFRTAIRLSQVMATLTVALGLIVLAGWAFDIEGFKTFFVGTATMKANTALGYFLCGAALMLGYLSPPNRVRKRFSLVFAIFAVLIGGVTLLEYAAGVSLGLDEILFLDNTDASTISSPGRMSPNSALCMVLYGSAILLLGRGIRGVLLAHIFTFTGLFIALLSTIGYLFHAELFIAIFSTTVLTVHSVVALWLIGLSICARRPKKGLMAAILANNPGGFIARRLIAPAIIVPLFFGWIAFQGFGLKYYDAGFTASLIVLSSMVVICVLTTRSIMELNGWTWNANVSAPHSSMPMRAKSARWKPRA